MEGTSPLKGWKKRRKLESNLDDALDIESSMQSR